MSPSLSVYHKTTFSGSLESVQNFKLFFFFFKINSRLRKHWVSLESSSSNGPQGHFSPWAAQVHNLQYHSPRSCHGALCLAQCQLDSSMPQMPGAGLLHLHSLFTVVETSQWGQAQVDLSTHSEDVSPD